MLTIDWTLPIASAAFIVTLISLNHLLFKPIFRILDERRSQTSGLLEKAQEKTNHYERLLEQCEERIKEQKQKGYQRAQERRSEALKERLRQLSEARGQATELIEEAKRQLEGEAVSAHQQLKLDAEEIAQVITRMVLHRI